LITGAVVIRWIFRTQKNDHLLMRGALQRQWRPGQSGSDLLVARNGFSMPARAARGQPRPANLVVTFPAARNAPRAAYTLVRAVFRQSTDSRPVSTARIVQSRAAVQNACRWSGVQNL